MTLINVVREFFATPAGTGVVLLFALAALDFLMGTFAALRDGTFQLDAIAAWIRKHIAGRVLPVTAVLVIGHMLGGLTLGGGLADVLSPGTVLTTIGLGAAGVYVLEVIGSVKESLTPKPVRAIEEVEEHDSFGSPTITGAIVSASVGTIDLSNVRKVPQD